MSYNWVSIVVKRVRDASLTVGYVTVVDNQRQKFLYLGNVNFLEESKDRFELGRSNNIKKHSFHNIPTRFWVRQNFWQNFRNILPC